MEIELTYEEQAKKYKGTLRSYKIGLLSCFCITTLSFLIVLLDLSSKETTIVLISLLAVIQAIVQLKKFLHLGSGKQEEASWDSMIFFTMLSTLLIIVIGSLWIMHDLHLRTMKDLGTHNHTESHVMDTREKE